MASRRAPRLARESKGHRSGYSDAGRSPGLRDGVSGASTSATQCRIFATHDATPQRLRVQAPRELDFRPVASVAENATSAFLHAAKRDHDVMSVESIHELLERVGLDPSSPCVAPQLQRFTRSDGKVTIPTWDTQNILTKATGNRLAIPRWNDFCDTLVRIFEDIRETVDGGKNADYIPVLAEQDRQTFAISVTTVDGQQFSYGDSDAEFSIQSCCKPLVYSMAIDDHGLHKVHSHVGIEPSGLAFNEVSLNVDNLPHNPFINAGAMVTGAWVGPPEADMSERFQYFMRRVRQLAGGQDIGFSNSTYLCEADTAYRNNALMYYMTEAGVFPRGMIPAEVLDFYIQCCSMEINTGTGANIAATMANGGVSPLTGERCLRAETVKACLTLMYSCGMYDFSGQWGISVGLPAKSGVAGLIYVVIPRVAGIAVFSPPLDSHGNSVRGVEFCKRLLAEYPFGIMEKIVADGLARLEPPRDAAHSYHHPSAEEGDDHTDGENRTTDGYDAVSVAADATGHDGKRVIATGSEALDAIRRAHAIRVGREKLHSGVEAASGIDDLQPEGGHADAGGLLLDRQVSGENDGVHEMVAAALQAATGMEDSSSSSDSEEEQTDVNPSARKGGHKHRPRRIYRANVKAIARNLRMRSALRTLGTLYAALKRLRDWDLDGVDLSQLVRLQDSRALSRGQSGRLATFGLTTKALKPKSGFAAVRGAGEDPLNVSLTSRSSEARSTSSSFINLLSPAAMTAFSPSSASPSPTANRLLAEEQKLPPGSVALYRLQAFLHRKGISTDKRVNPTVAELLDRMQRSRPRVISLRGLICDTDAGCENIVVRALLGTLVVPDFEEFQAKVTGLVDSVRAHVPSVDAFQPAPPSQRQSSPTKRNRHSGVDTVEEPSSGPPKSASSKRPGTPAWGDGTESSVGATEDYAPASAARVRGLIASGKKNQETPRPSRFATPRASQQEEEEDVWLAPTAVSNLMGAAAGMQSRRGGDDEGDFGISKRLPWESRTKSGDQAPFGGDDNDDDDDADGVLGVGDDPDAVVGGALGYRTPISEDQHRKQQERLHRAIQSKLGFPGQDRDRFSVAICTCDGQQLVLGDPTVRFPLMETIKPLLYAMALEDAGYEATHEWVGAEPTSMDPEGFDLLAPGGGGHGGASDSDEDDVDSVESVDSGGQEDRITMLRSGNDARRPFSRLGPPRAADQRSVRKGRTGSGSVVSKMTGALPGGNHRSTPVVGGGFALFRDDEALGGVAATDDPKSRGKKNHERPYNPFTLSGALESCSVIGRGHEKEELRLFHDSGSRFVHVMDRLRAWSGGRKVYFNNPVFLTLKQRALKTLAVSNFLKGMEAMPPRSDPGDIANFLFQCYSVEMGVRELSTIAATIAHLGVCPSTNKRELRLSSVKSLLSLMYSCGLNQWNGRWQFKIGIPSCSGSTGAVMIIVPNVMGIAIYAPTEGPCVSIPRRALKTMEILVKHYHLNLFDQLVYAEAALTVQQHDEGGPRSETRSLSSRDQTILFFELCMASAAGDAAKVRGLLHHGADPTKVDYDLRTPLHVAACEGSLEVCRLLVHAGADILAVDRWGTTPFEEAQRGGHKRVVSLLNAALLMSGRRLPTGGQSAVDTKVAEEEQESPSTAEFVGDSPRGEPLFGLDTEGSRPSEGKQQGSVSVKSGDRLSLREFSMQ